MSTNLVLTGTGQSDVVKPLVENLRSRGCLAQVTCGAGVTGSIAVQSRLNSAHDWATINRQWSRGDPGAPAPAGRALGADIAGARSPFGSSPSA